MNSKMNRSIKGKKNSSQLKAEDQTLKGETSKIQNKLQTLKAQIAMRKTIKNKEKQIDKTILKATHKNSTAERWALFNKSTSKLNSQSSDKISNGLVGSKPAVDQEISPDRIKLISLLKQLNMEPFKEIIMSNYGIQGLQKLLEQREEDIEAWKNIPIGFKIKLKQFLKEHAKSKDSRIRKEEGEEIQAIIQRRKTEKVYEPICDKELDEEQYEEEIETDGANKQGHPQQELDSENEQDILISSLNSAFLQRRGIIKKTGSCESINSNHSKNKVKWDSKVVEYNKQTSNFEREKLMTKYPRPTQKAQGMGNWDEIDKVRSYCWQCLKKISKIEQVEQFEEYQEGVHRSFCNNKCKKKYHVLTNQKAGEREVQNQDNSQNVLGEELDDLDLELS